MQQMPALLRIAVPGLVVLAVLLAGCGSTPVPQQEAGSVRVLSSPPGAGIYLDDEYRGTAPATVAGVPAGNHTLEIRKDGYDRWASFVAVRPGDIVNISATLNAIPATAMPVTFASAAVPTARQGSPEIHIDGYWSFPQGISTTESPVPILIHADGFNVGDGDARIVTASANLYYGGREVCWKTVFFGTLKAGSHVPTDTMVSCPLPSGVKSGDMTLRFDNVVVTP